MGQAQWIQRCLLPWAGTVAEEATCMHIITSQWVLLTIYTNLPLGWWYRMSRDTSSKMLPLSESGNWPGKRREKVF